MTNIDIQFYSKYTTCDQDILCDVYILSYATLSINKKKGRVPLLSGVVESPLWY